MAATMSGDREGAIYLFWGPVPCTAQVASQADVILRGEAGSYFGVDVDVVDLDADGLPDLVAGALRADGAAGAARIFSGASLVSGGTDPDAEWAGSGGDFGEHVDASGDADGDGWPDLVISATAFGGGTFDQPGRTYVYYSPGITSGVAADADVRLDGDAHTNDAGGAYWAGDVNGDGYADLLLTNPAYDDVGAAFLFYGPVSADLTRNAEADATFLGGPQEALGSGGGYLSEYALGDVDEDGDDEFILPSTGRLGTIWLFDGGR